MESLNPQQLLQEDAQGSIGATQAPDPMVTPPPPPLTHMLRTATLSESASQSGPSSFIGRLETFHSRTMGDYKARVLPAKELMQRYPPKWVNGGKKLLYSISTPNLDDVEGEIVVKGWPQVSLPAEFPKTETPPKLVYTPELFEHTNGGADEMHWYLNFADPTLFVAYQGGLFAQDEMQCAMIPALPSIKEAYGRFGQRLSCIVEDRNIGETRCNPFTFRGVQHRLDFKVDPNAEEGRPEGLYGNRFSYAKPEVLQKAASKPTPRPTNVLCMAAPRGDGEYSELDVEWILTTCYTGYLAIKAESEAVAQPPLKVFLHTGHWGCGAFGGNKTLMALLQFAAARLAGLDTVVYHVHLYPEPVQAAATLLEGMQLTTPSEFIQAVVAKKFIWGFSDGN